MKKFSLIVSFALIITLIPAGIFSLRVFSAEACTIEQFTLSNINRDKSTTQVGCYDDFSTANTAMKANKQYNDLIITHDTSRSPSKIIAASRAIASSYTPRWQESSSNASTAVIWRNSNRSGDTTYISSYYDMAYYETVSFNTSDGSGTSKIQTSGFVGYIRLIQIDIIPMIYVEEEWPIQLGGQTYNEYYKDAANQAQPYSVVPKLSYYSVYTNQSSNVREIRHYISSLRTGNYGSYLYGLAPDWLKNGVYYSWDSISFYQDRQMTQPVLNGDSVGEYFNYYQYLPLRSSSVYDAKQLDDYLTLYKGYTSKPRFNDAGTYIGGSAMYGEGEAFFNSQNTYGVNGLLTYALAIHESGHGTSSLARTKNNLFGWGAHDSNPSDAYLFESITQSVSEHMGKNLRGFLSTENWRYFGQVFGNKNNGFNAKYASDPYWGNKIAGHAYQIDRYHGFQDYGQYQVALVNKEGAISVKDSASTSSKELFATRSTLKQQIMLVTDMRKEGNNTFVQVMSPMTVENNEVVRFNTTYTQVLPYNWQDSVGYLVNEPLKILTNGTEFAHTPNVINKQIAQKPSVARMTSLKITDNKLDIDGYHYQEGVSIVSTSDISHKLTLRSVTDEKLRFDLTSKNNPSINDLTSDKRFIAENMGVSGVIDIKDVAVGTYALEVESTTNISMTPLTYTNQVMADNVDASFTTNNKVFTLKSDVYKQIYLHVKSIEQDQFTTDSLLIFNQLNNEQVIALKGSGITLESSDNKVVTVTNDGKITAVGSGIANVTIKQNNEIKAVVGAVVVMKLDAIEITNSSLNITKEDQVEIISVKATPASATNKGYVFISQNSIFASVNEDGLITQRNNGRTKITVISKSNPSLQAVVNVVVNYEKSTSTPDEEPPVEEPPVVVPEGLVGDVNMDGKVTTTDLVILRRYLAGLEQISAQGKLNADIDKNGNITTTDLVKLRRRLAGLE